MKWQYIRQKRWFKIVSNKYVLATLAFAVWMLFIDSNSWLIHRELNQEINELEESRNYYETQIAKDRQQLDELSADPEKLEKFAREQYLLKKPGEEIYLIREEEKME